MKIYLICPVRIADGDAIKLCEAYVADLESKGHKVHYPAQDIDQSLSATDINIGNMAALESADEIHVIWQPKSYGSHFDLGMAFVLRKPIKLVHILDSESIEKNYLDVIYKWPW